MTSKAIPGGPTLTHHYDRAGNLLAAGGDGRPGLSWYYYDKVNRLHQMSEATSGRINIFAYDAGGRRTDIWYGASYVGGGGVRYDATGNNVVPPNGLGSVVGLVAPNGIQRARYSYDPYGANHTATAMNGTLPPNPWRFTGGYLDPTGLYHLGTRYYDPGLGRWTQQDSVEMVGDPAKGNRYAYSGHDPVNFVDPSGRFRIRFFELDWFSKEKAMIKALHRCGVESAAEAAVSLLLEFLPGGEIENISWDAFACPGLRHRNGHVF